ncbi:MAG: transposase [Acidimicrobiales bacterium]
MWRGGSAWALKHEAWLRSLRFEDVALASAFGYYRAVVEERSATLDAVESDLSVHYGRPLFADAVARLSAYRGIARLGALTLACEVCDWRRFGQASAFMGFTGLVPSEYSSGGRTHRGRITKAGNWHLRKQLIESAWAYQHVPRRGRRAAPAPGGRPARDRGPGVGRPGPAVRAVPAPGPEEELEERRRRRRSGNDPRSNYAQRPCRQPGAFSQGQHPAEDRHACSDPRTTEWRQADPPRPDASPSPANPPTTMNFGLPAGWCSSRHPSVKTVRPRFAAGAPS